MKTLQERYNSFIRNIESEIKLEIHDLIVKHGVSINYKGEVIKVLDIRDLNVITDEFQNYNHIFYISLESIYVWSGSHFKDSWSSISIELWIDLITRIKNHFKIEN